MNNPMVDVDLKANTTRAENYRASGNVYGQWDFLKNFQFKVMYSMDYASNSSRTYTPVINVFDSSVEGNVVTLGNGKTGVKQSKETEAKVQSDYLLTYTNTWGDHSLTATAGFTTYYNKLEMLGGERTQGVGLVIPDNPDKWYISIGDAATATNESKHGSAVPYPCWDVCSITTKADTCSTVRSAATVPPHSPTPETSGRISTPSAQAG